MPHTGAPDAAAFMGQSATPSSYGTVIPNRVFVGGLAGDATEYELRNIFAKYGNVISSKIIVDRTGVSKGYGFITFETEAEALRIQTHGECIILRDRKLNIAPAIKKNSYLNNSGQVYYNAPPYTNAYGIDALGGQGHYHHEATAMVPIHCQGGIQFAPMYQYYAYPQVVEAGVDGVWAQPAGYEEN